MVEKQRWIFGDKYFKVFMAFVIFLAGCVPPKNMPSPKIDRYSNVFEESIFPENEKSIKEITETIFDGFPSNPEWFDKNNVVVEIHQTKFNNVGHSYFGLSPVYVNGRNFTLIYSTEKGYNIEKVILKGKTIFSDWNKFLGVEITEIKKTWGEPLRDTGNYILYDSEDYWISVIFQYKNNRVTQIEITHDP